MRNAPLMAVSVLLLAACSRPASSPPDAEGHGRYTGVGTYAPGELWPRMAEPVATRPAGAATTADDEHVIVLVDGRTGEVRECGDYSGVCVSLQPWTRAIAAPQTAPVTLTKHLADLRAQERAAAQPQEDTRPGSPHPRG